MSNISIVLNPLGLGCLPDESVVRAAFIPFGEIVEKPPDCEIHEKHRGFSFIIEYKVAGDAAAAIDNMVIYSTINQRFINMIQYFLQRKTELFGKTITVNIVRPPKIKEGYSRTVFSF